jgi:hypothetical protein
LESFHKSRTARLGGHHSDREYLFFVQGRGATRLVGNPDVHSFVNFIIWIILCIDVAKSFGKGVGFGIGLLLLPFIFFLILGFGSAQYQGPSASPGVAVASPPQPA